MRIGNVIANFPEIMIEIAGCYNENSNDEGIGSNPHLDKMGRMEGYDKVYNQRNTGSTKRKTKSLDFAHRLGFDNYDNVS